MADIEYVRVKDTGTGHEYSVVKSAYDAAEPGIYKLLDKPATQPDGTPLPAKHNALKLPNTSRQTGHSADPNEGES